MTVLLPDTVRVIGVTGTREGMTLAQGRRATELLMTTRTRYRGPGVPELHHGDCVGADAELHSIARPLGYRTVVHPPIGNRYRAHCEADWTWEPQKYLVRDAAIADSADVLLAFPKDMTESRFGGTWWTVSYARSIGRHLVIVWPDGTETP